MFNGGSQFWEWFTDRVADKVAKHELMQLIQDVQQSEGDKCSFCHLPSNEIKCPSCNDCYCLRDHFCKPETNNIKLPFACDSCKCCVICHDKCCVCGVIGCVGCDSHEISLSMCPSKTCKFHFYCLEHREEALKLCKENKNV